MTISNASKDDRKKWRVQIAAMSVQTTQRVTNRTGMSCECSYHLVDSFMNEWAVSHTYFFNTPRPLPISLSYTLTKPHNLPALSTEHSASETLPSFFTFAKFLNLKIYQYQNLLLVWVPYYMHLFLKVALHLFYYCVLNTFNLLMFHRSYFLCQAFSATTKKFVRDKSDCLFLVLGFQNHPTSHSKCSTVDAEPCSHTLIVKVSDVSPQTLLCWNYTSIQTTSSSAVFHLPCIGPQSCHTRPCQDLFTDG